MVVGALGAAEVALIASIFVGGALTGAAGGAALKENPANIDDDVVAVDGARELKPAKGLEPGADAEEAAGVDVNPENEENPLVDFAGASVSSVGARLMKKCN